MELQSKGVFFVHYDVWKKFFSAKVEGIFMDYEDYLKHKHESEMIFPLGDILDFITYPKIKEYLGDKGWKGYLRLLGKEEDDEFSERFATVLEDVYLLSPRVAFLFSNSNFKKEMFYYVHLPAFFYRHMTLRNGVILGKGKAISFLDATWDICQRINTESERIEELWKGYLSLTRKEEKVEKKTLGNEKEEKVNKREDRKEKEEEPIILSLFPLDELRRR